MPSVAELQAQIDALQAQNGTLQGEKDALQAENQELKVPSNNDRGRRAWARPLPRRDPVATFEEAARVCQEVNGLVTEVSEAVQAAVAPVGEPSARALKERVNHLMEALRRALDILEVAGSAIPVPVDPAAGEGLTGKALLRYLARATSQEAECALICAELAPGVVAVNTLLQEVQAALSASVCGRVAAVDAKLLPSQRHVLRSLTYKEGMGPELAVTCDAAAGSESRLLLKRVVERVGDASRHTLLAGNSMAVEVCDGEVHFGQANVDVASLADGTVHADRRVDGVTNIQGVAAIKSVLLPHDDSVVLAMADHANKQVLLRKRSGGLPSAFSPSGVIKVPNNPYGVAFNPDGSMLAVGLYGSGSVALYDLRTCSTTDTPEPVATISGAGTPSGNLSNAFKVAWSPCGRFLAVTQMCAGGPVTLWDVTTPSAPAFVRVCGMVTHTTGVAFSPCGNLLLVAQYSPGRGALWVTHVNPAMVAPGMACDVRLEFDAHNAQDLCWHDGGIGIAQNNDSGTVMIDLVREGPPAGAGAAGAGGLFDDDEDEW